MAMRYKFPIRYKILGVLSAVVVAAVALYLYLASHIFHEDKTQLIYELNESNVKTLSSDVEIAIKRALDKLKLITQISANFSSMDLSAVLTDEEELVRVVSVDLDENLNPIQEKVIKFWPKQLEEFKKDETYLTEVRSQVPVNFKAAFEKSIWIRNSTLHSETPVPLYTLAVKVDSTDVNVRRVIFAEIKLDEVLGPFARSGIAKTYAVDSEGFVLAHSDSSQVFFDNDFKQDPLIMSATSSKVRSAVLPFELEGKTFLGSYFHVGLAHIVIASKVERDQAMAAARRLVEKSLIYALIVITAAFLIAIFFSHTLTAPIHGMLEATQAIAKGDFNQQVRVSTSDELAMLATSFNSMTVDLKSSRAQIEEYSRDLEKKVHDRTSELEASNIAIKETQEALVRTTRLASVGEVAGRAAHEVLNPLTNVIARLERSKSKSVVNEKQDLKLQSEILSAWQKAYTEKGKEGFWEALGVPSQAVQGKTLFEEDIENLISIAADATNRVREKEQDIEFLLKEAQRIAKIVNNMRHMTRVSGDKRALDIHALLEETLLTMKDVLNKHKIFTESRFVPDQLWITADHDELLQVFSNLLRNSMQAIVEALMNPQLDKPVGNPPKIWITTQVVEAGATRTIQIRVCDNGPGIDPQFFKTVFETSFTTKPVDEGTGLGLSIARRFIRAYDGEIIVERSEPGVETVFLIELPEAAGPDASEKVSGNA